MKLGKVGRKAVFFAKTGRWGRPNAFRAWLNAAEATARTHGSSRRNLWAARPIRRIICGPNESEAGVAQAVEQRIRNAWVGGSNPSTGIPEFHFDNSKGCGGVMRVAPAGLFTGLSRGQAFDLAARCAAQTHGHPSGYLSAGAMAAIVRGLLDGLEPAAAADRALDLARDWRLKAGSEKLNPGRIPHVAAEAGPGFTCRIWLDNQVESSACAALCAIVHLARARSRAGALFPRHMRPMNWPGYAAAGWRQSTHGAGTRPDLGPSPLPQALVAGGLRLAVVPAGDSPSHAAAASARF